MTAVLSADGVYRYELWRTAPLELGSYDNGTVAFCMLNPSTADAVTNDPTIRRCMGFAQRWGYSRLAVCNLYAYRTASPADLFLQTPGARGDAGAPGSSGGMENEWHVKRVLQDSDLHVAAWGVHGHATLTSQRVLGWSDRWWCLGTTANGAPRHPLYVPAKADLVRYA